MSGHWFSDKDGKKKEWSAAAVMQGRPLQLELVEAPPGVKMGFTFECLGLPVWIVSYKCGPAEQLPQNDPF